MRPDLRHRWSGKCGARSCDLPVAAWPAARSGRPGACRRAGRDPALRALRRGGMTGVLEAHGVEEVSLGDFVLSGGEPAALALVDAVVRLLPGVMGNEETAKRASNGDCWNIPIIRGQPTGRDAWCRRFCFPATTKRYAAWRLAARRRRITKVSDGPGPVVPRPGPPARWKNRGSAVGATASRRWNR